MISVENNFCLPSSQMNCLLAGVGGQGTVLMSRLIGTAALARGWHVRGAETIGMAQRGGSVASHIRFCGGGGVIHSPLIPPGKADLVIAFEPAEALRVLPFLAPACRMIALDRGIAPASGGYAGRYEPAQFIVRLRETLQDRLLLIDGEALISRLGSARVLNAALLGFSAGRFLPFTLEEFSAALANRLPERFLELNERALREGAAL
jgi:indolepyruvate ferredoxin oxidoreductase beta subunit